MGKEFTHDDIVEIGFKWVSRKTGFAFKELKTMNREIPDVIGFNSIGTFLLEAKASRSDFLSDKNKDFRKNSFMGMGDWRFYIAPKGMINIDDLPEDWGLIEVNETGKPRVKHNPFGKGNIYSDWKRCKKNIEAEINMMYSALRRLEIRGLINEIYTPIGTESAKGVEVVE